MKDIRIVKKKIGTNWATISFSELKTGDVFILIEDDNILLGKEWIATSNPIPDDKGIYGVEADEHGVYQPKVKSAKKPKATFEEMLEIYQNWLAHDKTGTQDDVFKRQGWTRTKFFNECSERGVDA